MKRVLLTYSLFLMCHSSMAQTTISSFSKISSTSGNLTSIINDSDQFGVAVDSLGDLNNDGVNDIVIGANRDDDGGIDKGAVYILFLNEDGTVQSEQKISDTQGDFTGVLNTQDVFGTAVASIGDLNNDGINDIAVGAEYDGDGGYWSGAVWILFLNTDGTVQSHNKINETDLGVDIPGSPTFGSSIANIGDINGDGIVDLAVGSRRDEDGGSRRGAVWILFLDEDGTVQSHQKISHTQGYLDYDIDYEDYFGCDVKNIGDLNADGINDIAVGSYKDDDGETNNGAVYIIFLHSDGTVLDRQKISSTEGGFNGELSNGAYFGISVSPAGDLDGDCIMDLIVGAAKQETINGDSGAAFIVYLNEDGTVKNEQEISPGLMGFNTNLTSGDLFGRSVAFIGELGDVKTLIIGASKDDDGGTDRGATWTLKLKGTIDAPCNTDIEDTQVRNLFFYPNPTEHYIKVTGINQETNLLITNTLGQTLIDCVIRIGLTIDVSHLNKGIYFVSVSDSYTGKLIIK